MATLYYTSAGDNAANRELAERMIGKITDAFQINLNKHMPSGSLFLLALEIHDAEYEEDEIEFNGEYNLIQTGRVAVIRIRSRKRLIDGDTGSFGTDLYTGRVVPTTEFTEGRDIEELFIEEVFDKVLTPRDENGMLPLVEELLLWNEKFTTQVDENGEPVMPSYTELATFDSKGYKAEVAKLADVLKNFKIALPF